MSISASDPGSALGRIPSGVFILTVQRGARSTGMLASWVQQAGFEPPMVTVAVRKDRFVAEWITEAGGFNLNQIATGHKGLLKHFGRGFGPEDHAFEGLSFRTESSYGPVLEDVCSYLVVELVSSIDGGDHRIFLGKVVDGARVDPEAEPMIHLRKSGLHY